MRTHFILRVLTILLLSTVTGLYVSSVSGVPAAVLVPMFMAGSFLPVPANVLAAGVSVVKVVSSLGGSAPATDGITLLLYPCGGSGYASLSAVLYNLADAEGKGITQANDLTHTTGLWRQIKDFYRTAPKGTKLYIRGYDDTIANELEQDSTRCNSLHDYLYSKNGDVKLLCIMAKTTGSGITPVAETVITQLLQRLQAFADAELASKRPIDILLEGTGFILSTGEYYNLRGKGNAGNVSVIIGQEKEIHDIAYLTNYAAVGLFAGSVAASHVGRNAGRTKSGALPIVESVFAEGAYYGETQINNLNTSGYIFFEQYMGVAGWFWNDDHTCTTAGMSNSQLSLNRVWNKAARITLATYVNELKDEIETDAVTGKLSPLVVATLENSLSNAIKNEMVSNPDPTRSKECVAVTVKIDPAQNILATSKIVAQVSIVPLGVVREIVGNIALDNPA